MTNTDKDGYLNSGLGNDKITGVAASFEILEDHGGNDEIKAKGGNDLIISRDGGEIVTGGGEETGLMIQTLRVYPTHEKDHLFGAKDPSDKLQCTKFLDASMNTNFELVLDDLWYPDAKYTNEDDFCSVLVHGWELEWYWPDLFVATDNSNKVDIWFSRETGAADFCLSTSETDCEGP